jgi:hypothetical protein
MYRINLAKNLDSCLQVVTIQRLFGPDRGSLDLPAGCGGLLLQGICSAAVTAAVSQELLAQRKPTVVNVLCGMSQLLRALLLFSLVLFNSPADSVPQLDYLGQISTEFVGLIAIGQGLLHPRCGQVVLSPPGQSPDQPTGKVLAPAVTPHVVSFQQLESLIQPPVGQRTLGLFYP